MFHNISDNECSHCRPDCETTIYSTKVTTSPLRKCEVQNMGISFLCNFFDPTLPEPKHWANHVLERAPPFAPEYIFEQVVGSK